MHCQSIKPRPNDRNISAEHIVVCCCSCCCCCSRCRCCCCCCCCCCRPSIVGPVCLAPQHNTMIPTRTRIRTARFGIRNIRLNFRLAVFTTFLLIIKKFLYDKPERRFPCLIKQVLICTRGYPLIDWRCYVFVLCSDSEQLILPSTCLHKPWLRSRLWLESRFRFEPRLCHWLRCRFRWLLRLGFNSQEFVQVIFNSVLKKVRNKLIQIGHFRYII